MALFTSRIVAARMKETQEKVEIVSIRKRDNAKNESLDFGWRGDQRISGPRKDFLS